MSNARKTGNRENNKRQQDNNEEQADRRAKFMRLGQLFKAVDIKRQEQLFEAVANQNIQLLRALKPDVSEILTPNSQGIHALHLAATSKSQPVLDYFYNVAAAYYYELDLSPGQARKPLRTDGYQHHHWVIYTGKDHNILWHTVETLKSDLRAATKDGKTALSIAHEVNNEVAIDFLRSKGIMQARQRRAK